jgi:hypothetical protein
MGCTTDTKRLYRWCGRHDFGLLIGIRRGSDDVLCHFKQYQTADEPFAISAQPKAYSPCRLLEKAQRDAGESGQGLIGVELGMK